MCRFVAYLGKKEIRLKDILEDSANSLIKQSLHANKGNHRINADGFGIAWYNHDIDDIPGIFRSIRPAWNDVNLRSIAAKVKSQCFLGHVRSSTEGSVGVSNCHPFFYDKYSMVHNGGIHKFHNIKKRIIADLDDDIFNLIQGHTDSEFFFSIILNFILKKGLSIEDAILKSIDYITELQEKYNNKAKLELNIAFTDGYKVYATKYAYQAEHCSLFYSIIHNGSDQNTGIVVASEPLSDYEDKTWFSIDNESLIIIDPENGINIERIKAKQSLNII